MSKQAIWNFFRAKGLSEKGTAALMGNIEAESNYFAPRIQGDFSAGWTRSIVYTDQVDQGVISRNDFIHHGPGGGGYGLIQFTYPTRKAALYDKAKQARVSIGNLDLQLNHIWDELHYGEYAPTWNMLNSDASLYDMTAKVLRNFERPADMSDGVAKARTNLAQAVLNEFGGREIEPVPDPINPIDPEPDTPQPSRGTCITEHRINCMGDTGRDVYMLQRGLEDMNYHLGDYGCDGAFGGDTEAAVRKMQADCNLRIDGIAGEEVWQVLFQ